MSSYVTKLYVDPILLTTVGEN